MKQRVRERFESMRHVLNQDEQAVLDSLELDLRRTRGRMDQVLKDWMQHQEQVTKSISSTQAALSNSLTADQDIKVCLSSCMLAVFSPLKIFLRCSNEYFCFRLLFKVQCENVR